LIVNVLPIARFEIIFVRDAFSRKVKKKNLFQPLTILEIEAVHKRHFRKFKEIKSARLFIPSIPIFIRHHGDVHFKLHHSIHEEEENEPLLLS
jgi:hypothetical protein